MRRVGKRFAWRGSRQPHGGGNLGGVRKMLAAAVSALCLSACDEAPAPPKAPELLLMKCGKYDVAVEIADAGALNAAINGEKLAMNSAASADGARYEGRGAATTAALRSKGKDWSLSIAGGPLIPCKPAGKR